MTMRGFLVTIGFSLFPVLASAALTELERKIVAAAPRNVP